MRSFIAAALVVAGMIGGILVAEGGLRLLKGAPPRIVYDENFYWEYVDIHDPFFKKDRTGGSYMATRPRSHPLRFPVIKGKSEKRIFIVGESVAYFYENTVLQGKFKEVFPGYDWKVINCGMGGYDSYRVALVVDKIMRYRPDLIIMMMGNNDGYPDPVRINDWIYRVPLLSRLWTTRLATDYLNPARKVTASGYNKYFEGNVRRIALASEKHGVPLVMCTIPSNHKISYGFYGNRYKDKTYFSLLWLAEKSPSRAVRMFLGQGKDRDGEDRLSRYCLAGMYRKLGDDEKANMLYRKNVPLRKEERNDIIRKVSAEYKGAILADVDKRIMELAGGEPGFDYFWDQMHYWPPVYRLITDEIIGALYLGSTKNPFLSGIKFDRGRYLRYSAADIAALLKENRNSLTDEYYRKFGGRFLNDYLLRQASDTIDTMKYVLKEWYRLDPKMIAAFRNNKDKVLAWVRGDKVSSWNMCLALVGEVLREEKELRTALLYLDEAVRADGQNHFAYLFRGLCHYDMGKRKLAEKDFLRLKELNSGFEWLTVRYLDSLLDESSENGKKVTGIQ